MDVGSVGKEVEVEGYEQAQLDAEAEEVGEYRGDGYD